MEDFGNQIIHFDGNTPGGILGQLEEKRIVAFRISPEGDAILVEECCDGYFGTKMSAKEFDEMLCQLGEMRNKLRASGQSSQSE